MPQTYNCKNYFAHGGNELVIGGKLTFLEGAETEGMEGVLPVAENQADSTATTVANLKEDFNALLAKLKAAGLMAADPETEPDPDGNGEGDGDDDENGEGGDT